MRLVLFLHTPHVSLSNNEIILNVSPDNYRCHLKKRTEGWKEGKGMEVKEGQEKKTGGKEKGREGKEDRRMGGEGRRREY